MTKSLALWLVAVAVLMVLLGALHQSGRLKVHSSLLALLPATEHDPVEAAAHERLAALAQTQVTFYIGGRTPESREHAPFAAMEAAKALRASGAFSWVSVKAGDQLSTADRQALDELIVQSRFNFLSAADLSALERLNEGDTSTATYFTDRAKARLYGLGLGGSLPFADDPFGLAAMRQLDVARASMASGVAVSPTGQFRVDAPDGTPYSVVLARTLADPFVLAEQAALANALATMKSAISAVHPDLDFLLAGALPHALHASAQAQREMSVIGGGGLLAILALMVWAFSCIRPFILAVMAVGAGSLLGAGATSLIFAEIHIVTLIFGASLVGVAVDYSFHYFAERRYGDDPALAMKRILPAITMGLLTTVMAFGSLAIAPFPGLRQMACFAVFGLLGAWATVVLTFPALTGSDASHPQRRGVAPLAAGWTRLMLGLANGRQPVIGIVMLVSAGVGLASALLLVTPRDDVRLLHSVPAALQAQEARLSSLRRSGLPTQALLVRGATAEIVAEREAAWWAAQGHDSPNAIGIGPHYVTPSQQREHHARLSKNLYAAGGLAETLLGEVGFSQADIDRHQADFTANADATLSIEDWLDSPLGASFQPLWLGRIGDEHAALILVSDLPNQGTMAVDSGISRLDRIGDLNQLLARYRAQISGLLLLAYGVAAGILLCRLRPNEVLAVLTPPALASVLVILIGHALGQPFSVFSAMSLILVLGMGADYGIFLRTAHGGQMPATVAIILAATTTLLAFGLLALSETPVLRHFGSSLAIGIPLTFVLSSLVNMRSTSHTSQSAPSGTMPHEI